MVNSHSKVLGVLLISCLIIMACDPQVENKDNSVKKLSDNAEQEFYGTAHPFAQESVYFVMTDRFVDGDSSNN